MSFLAALIVLLVLYWSIARWRWARLSLLLVASLAFYSVWKPGPLVLYGLATLVNWSAGALLERLTRGRKLVLTLAVLVHVGVLVTYKYLQLFLNTFGSLATWLQIEWKPPELGLTHPLGLSFMTFQAIGSIVDVYWKKTSGRFSPLHHLLFLTFFPRVVSGPILRNSQLLEKFDATPTLDGPTGAEALFRITQGLAKKLLFADVLGGSFVNAVFSNPRGYSALECVIAAVGYTLQLYFDFSGYSDIAIGVAGLFGFKFPENFNKPYHATDLFSFWNRWHLTLSTWLRDYLYRPLGGNQGTRLQTLRNTMIVMSLGGLWHGGDWRFLIWGALHGVFLVLWRIWWWVAGKPKDAGIVRNVLGWLVMFNAVVFARIFFRADNLTLAIDMFKQLGTLTTSLARVSTLTWGSLAACIVFYALPAPVFEKTKWAFVKSPAVVRAAAIIALALLVRQFASIESQPYIYLQY